MSYNSPGQVTTGLEVCAQVVDANLTFQSPPTNKLDLSVSNTHGLQSTYATEIEIRDASGNVLEDVSLTLTGATKNADGTTTYAGTFSSGGTNNYQNLLFLVAGDAVDLGNNGYFYCISNTTTQLILANPNGVTHSFSGTAKTGSYGTPVYLSKNPSVATVNGSGVITAVAIGNTVIEISYPFCNNTLGTAPDGSYQEKIYLEIDLHVKS